MIRDFNRVAPHVCELFHILSFFVAFFTTGVAYKAVPDPRLLKPGRSRAVSHDPSRRSKIGRLIPQCRSHIGEAITAVETTKETWYEAEVHRIAGEIALMSPEQDAARAETHFERALAVARSQQAKSWELRAATSMARLWRDQGKRNKARELLAPVYGWFTEGFDTLDLREAKALLDELAS